MPCGVQQFSAVTTTGIYCRPGCPGRPRPDHVETFELAAAAEAAGFRACLRCRPYRSPLSPVRSNSELVCRGVHLIMSGALDGGTEAELGARMGLSDRHLRRLFRSHLGLTPDELARSRRAHFARRLLDDTDLTITDVAFASGFGSVRQLNRACVDIFRVPPRELRARRRNADRLVADGGLLLRLPFEGPLSWGAVTRYLHRRAIPGVEAVEDEVYRRTIVVDGDPGVLELTSSGAGDARDEMVLRAHLPHWEGLIHIVERARRIPGLDADLEGATAHLGADPTVGPLLSARPGLRVPGTWDPWETGVRAILGQQVTLAGASTLAGRFVERLGTPVPGLEALGLTHTFPSPETVAEGDLGGLGLPAGRQEAVRAFAQAVSEDRIRLDRSASLDELVGSITDVAGLGPWTAHYVALRAGEPDAFPAGDLGLRRSVAGAQAVPPAATLEALAERWRPWRALAAMHLWVASDVGPGATVSRTDRIPGYEVA